MRYFQMSLNPEQREDYKDEITKCGLVFTYGTLRKGFGNSRILTGHGATHMGSFVTQEPYLMRNVGCPYVYTKETVCEEFPHAYTVDELFNPVRGDVWSIPNEDCFWELDILEGHPDHYTRTTIIALDNEGNEHECWIYLQLNSSSLRYTRPVGLNDKEEFDWTSTLNLNKKP